MFLVFGLMTLILLYQCKSWAQAVDYLLEVCEKKFKTLNYLNTQVMFLLLLPFVHCPDFIRIRIHRFFSLII